jgi:hypothetical protein
MQINIENPDTHTQFNTSLLKKEYNDKIAAGTLDDYIRETIKRYDNNISKNGTLVYNLKGEDDTEYVDISKHRPLSIGK